MSARVFNPVIMTELSRLRATNSSVDKVNINSATQTNRSLITRVRRDLFGPVDHEETRKFVEYELSQQQVHDSERWGYDFLHDVPKTGHPKYTWERIASDKIPDVYTGARTRVVVHRPVPKTPDVVGLKSAITAPSNPGLFLSTSELFDTDVLTVSDILDDLESHEVDMIVEAETTPVSELKKDKHVKNSTTKIQYQSRITDFMKSRKRPASSTPSTSSSATKKLSEAIEDSPSPMKVARRIRMSDI